jgi:acetate kinase
VSLCVSWRFAQFHGTTRADYRMITCSLCTIDRAKVDRHVDGFTPLQGLVMGARSGDVDAGAILHLITSACSPVESVTTCRLFEPGFPRDWMASASRPMA